MFSLILIFMTGCGTIKTTNSFVEKLKSHDNEGAYTLLSYDSPHRNDKTEFGDFVDSTLITRYKFNSTSVESGIATVEGYIIDEGEKIDIAFTLVKDNGTWKILNWAPLE